MDRLHHHALSSLRNLSAPFGSICARQSSLESGEPLVLELARMLGTEATHLHDPAWPAYHALLNLDCADQLQEPGSNSAVGLAIPVRTMEDPGTELQPTFFTSALPTSG